MSLKIITNNVPRLIVDAYELTGEERKEFDYLDWSALDIETMGVELNTDTVSYNDAREAEFVRYKGQLYHLGDLELTSVPGWEGQHVDTYFSAVLFRFAEDDHDHVICGRCYS